MNISFCIPLKNNLRYFKRCYESILKNSDVPYEIVVYLDSDNDGTEKFLLKHNIKYTKNQTNECKGISHGYNECVKLSSNEVIMIFHADMMLGPKAVSNALKYLKEKTVISLTRIEPPLHPPGLEKIVMNFGFWPEHNIVDGFKENEFEKFVLDNSNSTKTTNGIFAPWIIFKKDIIDIGMHDEQFHSYHEDSDIFNRFVLSDYKLIQAWNAMVYHLTCRGGQFQDGLTVTKDSKFHQMKHDCALNYIRKWGCFIKQDKYSHPIIKNKYDIGFIIKNCNLEILSMLEPWCSTIYNDYKNLNGYILDNQPNTKFYNLSNRVKDINSPKINDVLIEFDGKLLNNERYIFLSEQLSDVLSESGEIGEMEYDIFKINIKQLIPQQKNLIKLQ